MKIKDIMTTDVVTVAPETPLKDVAATLVERGISGVPVCDEDGQVVGVVSETDILFKESGRKPTQRGPLAALTGGSLAELSKATARTAGEAMTKPPITVGSFRIVAEAARLMLENDVNRLPVVKHGKLVGIVSRADLVRAFTRTDTDIVREIREEVIEQSLWLEPQGVEVESEKGEVKLRV
jgi:CBS domain-containing protein